MRVTTAFLLAWGSLAGCSAAGDTLPPGSTRDGGGADAVADDIADDIDRTGTPDVAPVQIDASPPADGGDTQPCIADSDCANGNACTTAHCAISGEFGTCQYTPVGEGTACGGGSCPGTCQAGICHARTCTGTDAGTLQPPIDMACGDACPYSHLRANFPPYTPLLPDDAPATCRNGFELGGARGGCGVAVYTLHSRTASGSRAITLDVDFATYLVADGVLVTAVDATGARYTLLETCRLQTWNMGGPSTMRPPDESIRQFRLPLRRGTTEITFDFGSVTSPMYMRVVGLCDFDVTSFAANAAWWQAVP